MATYTAPVPNTAQLGSDAGYRLYVQHFINVLTHGGTSTRITRTADTGQINEATVVQPGNAVNTNGNWTAAPAIFKFEWTGITFYARFEFGIYKSTSGATTADLGIFLCRVSLGYGTDGASGLTDIFMPKRNLTSVQGYQTNQIATDRNNKTSYCCELDGYLGLAVEPTRKGAGQYPTDLNSDQGLGLVISKKTGSNKSLVVFKTAPANSAEGSQIYNSGTPTFDNAKSCSMSGFIIDLDTPYNLATDYSFLSTGIGNSSNGSSNIAGVKFTQRAIIPYYGGQYEDPNIIFAYINDVAYEEEVTINDDLGERNFIFLAPFLRPNNPPWQILGLRWE